MSAAPLKPLYPDSSTISHDAKTAKGADVGPAVVEAPLARSTETDLVSIKRIYTFAGQRTTEEKNIPSSQLDQYRSEGWKLVEDAGEDTGKETAEAEGKPDDVNADTAPKIRRPLRRPSRFDPNPTGQVRGLPPEHQLTWPRKVTTTVAPEQENASAAEAPRVQQRLEKAHKLNVVEKSRVDWTGYVDKEGIAEELDEHGKGKEAYLGRMQFLAGVEARREEERRRAKGIVPT